MRGGPTLNWLKGLLFPLLLLCCLGIYVVSQGTIEHEPVLFFYSEECPSCKKMHAFLDELLVLNPKIPLEMYEIDTYPEKWKEACTSAGIPAWGVPRIFIGEKVFADWREKDGELIYNSSYSGYVGYKNQIINALEITCGKLTLPECTEGGY